MLKAVEQRDKALAAAVAAARAKFSSPSAREKLEKAIRKKEAEINREFRKVRQQIQEELQEGKELTKKAAEATHLEGKAQAALSGSAEEEEITARTD